MHPVGLPHGDPNASVDHQAGEAVAVDEHDLFVLDLGGAIGGFTAEGRRGEEHTLGGSMALHGAVKRLHRRAPHALFLIPLGLDVDAGQP
jgi:hypothetical protein